MTANARNDRIAWGVLAAAMAVSATWLLISGDKLSFASDDLTYYVHYVSHGIEHVPTFGLEYLFAPSNGHLQVVGKIIYEVLFDLAGPNYFVFRAVNVAGVLLAVLLFFLLARKRVGPLPALIPCVSLLFLGFAWESLLWAFDMHTTYSLVFGLGTLLMLEREDRRGDVGACAFLILSIGLIELGLAFAVGTAIWVILRPRRWRRLWIFLIPLALYAVWWLWSRHFDQTTIFLTNVRLIPMTEMNALTAVSGSIFGVNPTGAGVTQSVTEITPGAAALAGILLAALVVRVARSAPPLSMWTFLGVVFFYWVLVALAARPPDSSRYILVGAVVVFLVAADALRGVQIRWPALVVACCVVALAIPPNVAKLYDGRVGQRNDGLVSRTEDGMMDLAKAHIRPDYEPGEDPRVTAVGGSVFTALVARDYLRAAREVGPIGFSPSEVAGQSPTLRKIADVALADALRIRLHRVSPPQDRGGCSLRRAAISGQGVEFALPRGGVLLAPPGNEAADVGIGRFGEPSEPSLTLARVAPGTWASLRAPADSYPRPWRVYSDGPLDVCPLPLKPRNTQ